MSENTFMSVPREKIDWYPRIDFAKCNYCMDCVKFCPHNVFEVHEDDNGQKFIVKNKKNCVVFCRACSKTCGLDLITFPDKSETIAKIKATRKEMDGND